MFSIILGCVVSAIGGAVIGFTMAAILASSKIRESENEYLSETGKYSLLKARIRAIQEHGKPSGVGKRERTYVIQTKGGRFSKFALPEV